MHSSIRPRALSLGGSALLLLALVSPTSHADEAAQPVSSTATPSARVAALDPRDAGAAFRLALTLEQQGHTQLAERAYAVVIAAEPDHRAARRALGYARVDGRWQHGDDLRRARGLIHHAGRWMNKEAFADATRPARRSAAQRAGEAQVVGQLAELASADPERMGAAVRRLAQMPDAWKLAPMAKSLRASSLGLRLYAARELGRLGNPLAAPALIKRAVHDPSPTVREAVVAALRRLDVPETFVPLARALGSRSSQTRIRAAEALAQLSDVAAIPHILYRFEGRSGDFPRVLFSSVGQRSYIQDFDVEVATSAFIADPIIGTLQEGAVQAVKILATEQTFLTAERVAYRKALVKLTGRDLGKDPAAWRAFWKREGVGVMAARLRQGQATQSR